MSNDLNPSGKALTAAGIAGLAVIGDSKPKQGE